jgi:hypothetical protein
MGVAEATSADFRGAIIVPGSDAANRAVASSHGCAGCRWTLVLDCDHNSLDDPEHTNCNGARCAPGGTRYRLYLQRPEDAVADHLDDVCLSATRRIVPASEVAVDLRRYLTRIAPPPPGITVQPDGRAVVGVATFFTAQGPSTDATELDVTTAAGPVRLRIEIAAATYAWTFGDGATCETTEPGGRYDGDSRERCDTRIAHTYASDGVYDVTLATTWTGRYTFDAGYGPVGPLDVPGTGVAAPSATRRVEVREAGAVLVEK